MLHGGGLGGLGGAYQDLNELYADPKLGYWEVAKRTPGAIDPGARVREMDEQGIDIAILYPTIGIVWEGETPTPKSPPLTAEPITITCLIFAPSTPTD